MIKVLIADDEPLVQAGIKSMINWSDLDMSIVGTASNGSIAYNMIDELHPDIIITDIKMPVMSGLELAKKCHEEKRDLPIFIFLTSFEDFQFVKEAMTYRVNDYLIKLELTPEALTESLNLAVSRLQEIQKKYNTVERFTVDSLYLMKDQFFTRLLLNLFESNVQFEAQRDNLRIDFDYDAFAVGYLTINSDKMDTMDSDKILNLYTSSMQVVTELISKYVPCHVIAKEVNCLNIIFFLKGMEPESYKSIIENALNHVSVMLYNYYNVNISVAIGSIVSSPLQISTSYQDAKQVSSYLDKDHKILFFDEMSDMKTFTNVFNLSLFKEDIRKAYIEYDKEALRDIFNSIIELFNGQTPHFIQALDAASSVLYMSLSLLNNGEQVVTSIFSDNPNGYRSLYELTTVEQIMQWLAVLRDGLCETLESQNKSHKNHIVENVKKYVKEHINEKLSLNAVSEIFNISPNYLSVLFSKFNDVGFTDYINQCKIEVAERMLMEGDYKIYEISDKLGFESAFYFSRVFKKVTGVSPRNYVSGNANIK